MPNRTRFFFSLIVEVFASAGVAAAAPWPVAVRALALEVAARGWRTSRGYTSVTFSADGTSKTWRRDGVGGISVNLKRDS